MTDHDTAEQNRIKRLKTARACDQCRRVRSRCDIANATAANSNESICERCRRLNLECTFILPIDETRGKRIPGKGNPDHNSPSQDSEGSSSSTIDLHADPVERFKTFIGANLPIISPRDLTNDSSILLHCCARLLTSLCVESTPDGTVERLKASLDAYMLSKSPFKTPTVQNVQALLLLAWLVDDPGYGHKFMTAVRMACSLGWNLQGQQEGANGSGTDGEDAVYVQYLWWTLVMQDIWLYLYSGIPLIINYRDFSVPCPPTPPLFVSLVSLSDVLRFKIRPSSLSDRLPTTTPYAALLKWQALHLPSTSTDPIYTTSHSPASLSPSSSLSPATPKDRERSLSAEAIIRLCHGAVLSIFILDNYNNPIDTLPQHAEYHLRAALQSNLDFPNVFRGIKLLERLAEICTLGLMRLSRFHGAGGTEMINAWGKVAGVEALRRLAALVDDESLGWGVVWRIGE